MWLARAEHPAPGFLPFRSSTQHVSQFPNPLIKIQLAPNRPTGFSFRYSVHHILCCTAFITAMSQLDPFRSAILFLAAGLLLFFDLASCGEAHHPAATGSAILEVREPQITAAAALALRAPLDGCEARASSCARSAATARPAPRARSSLSTTASA
ncbi:hypothetical protein B0H66DRAFT_386957 [Apodospora peruviana]|uniref:Uncharacterized protein n=1 Tax=Apodospora peruviana TaxID=516989 RepID=A0AAE0HUH6_9PEZI|nr:hypothetical protein B0H66DRAFT_386957 [Apodospora peruviana]